MISAITSMAASFEHMYVRIELMIASCWYLYVQQRSA
jgi:hypothetical protein